FDWESALLYSKARTEDEMDGVSMTGLQAAINKTTPDAYNPFVGGDLDNPRNAVFGVNNQDAIDSFMVRVGRTAETELMQWDFHVSRPDIYTLPAGDVGLAAGVEARRESFAEDRDDRLDGTITFTDLAIPVVSPEMTIPFVKSIDMQVAGRLEDYSLFGLVGAPKVALAYRPNDWLMFRTAWSKGFRAPNLTQLHQPDFQRSNSR